MVNLSSIPTEDVIEILQVLNGLVDGLSGGFNDEPLFLRAIEIGKACKAALESGVGDDTVKKVLEEDCFTNYR